MGNIIFLKHNPRANGKHIELVGFYMCPNGEQSPREAHRSGQPFLFSPDISDRPLMMRISKRGHSPGRRPDNPRWCNPRETIESYERRKEEKRCQALGLCYKIKEEEEEKGCSFSPSL